MTADDKTRAMRMIMGQSSVLRLNMAESKPKPDPDQGMLFRRSVDVPPDTDLEKLLSKWNPGVPPETIEDLMVSVCRWNQLKNSEAIRPGQKLLIPSVLPQGKEPGPRRVLSPADRRPVPQVLPQLSAKLAVGHSIAEQRLRESAAEKQAGRQQGVWLTQTQAGGATNVRQQLGGSIWQHNPQQQAALKLRG